MSESYSSVATPPIAPPAQPRAEVAPSTPLAPSRGIASPVPDRLTGIAVWRYDALAVLGILLLTALVSWHRLWLENGLAHLDIPTFYLPWYAHLGEALRGFDVPGWNPYQFSGTPFAADPQSGWMYWPAMVLFAVFEPVRAYEIFLVFHLLLAGVATYAFGRVLGLNVLGALVAAAIYEFGPLVNHISCCLIHVQLAVWVPVALLGIELMLRAGSWLGRSAAWCLAGIAVSQMLAGWVGQGAYNGVLLTGAYLAYRIAFSDVPGAVTVRERVARLLVDGAGIMAIGIGLAAGGLLPRLETVGRTNLAGGEYSGHEVDRYAGGWSVIMFLDRMLSDDNGFRSAVFYLGAPAVALLVMAPVLARRRFAVPFFLGVFAFTTLMLLNRTPLHDLAYLALPRYEVLQQHVPNRILVIQWIAPAMLAGASVHVLTRERCGRLAIRAAAVGFGAWALGVATLVILRRGIALETIVVIVITCGLVALWGRLATDAERNPARSYGRAQALVVLLLLLVVFWDPTGRTVVHTLATGDRGNDLLALPTGPVPREAIAVNAAETDPGGAGAFLQERQAAGEIFRFFGYDDALQHGGRGYPSTYREFYWLPEAQALLVNARAMRLGLYDAQGYNPVQLTRYIATLNASNHEYQNYHDAQILEGGLDSPVLDMLNVRYIVIPNETPPGRPRFDLQGLTATHKEVFRNDTIRVLENENALPRAWVVHKSLRAADWMVPRMIDYGAVDLRETALLPADSTPPPLRQPDDPAAETVQISHYEPDRIEIAASLGADGLVMVGETYDPAWSAYVDGEEVELYAANGVIRGVPVPAGDHTVELRYDPPVLRYGFLASVATGMIVVAILAAWVWRRLRPRAPAATASLS